MAGDDPGARLRATFAAELADQGQLLERYALALERTPDDLALLRSALRVAHTLKGAAAAAGVPAVETLCHAAEELLGGLARGGWASPDALQGLLALADRLREFAERLGAGSSPPVAALRALQAEREAIAEERRGAPAAVPASAPAPEDGAPAPAGFRVVPGKLDRLLATAGQAQLERAALHHRLTDLEGVLEDLQAAVRGPSPVGGRVEMAALAREGARRLDQVRRATRGLHGTIDRMAWDVTRLRLRPFAEACEALPRAVRELCRATGKEVRLHVEGEEVEADREVIEALREAVLPLVRNAVDHGIESADVRTARGKPAVGEVRVQAALRGDRVVVTVSDDGGGLDVAAVGARLRAAGTEAPDDPARLAELAVPTGV